MVQLTWNKLLVMKVEKWQMEKKLEDLENELKAMKIETKSESKEVKEVWTQCGLLSRHDKATQTDPYGLLTKEGLFSTSEAGTNTDTGTDTDTGTNTNTGLQQSVNKACHTLEGSGQLHLK